jgi:hypothetical protein
MPQASNLIMATQNICISEHFRFQGIQPYLNHMSTCPGIFKNPQALRYNMVDCTVYMVSNYPDNLCRILCSGYPGSRTHVLLEILVREHS